MYDAVRYIVLLRVTSPQSELDEFDPNGSVATPANVNQQRLGLSRRKN